MGKIRREKNVGGLPVPGGGFQLIVMKDHYLK
jgi:hypothetical protein